MKVNEQWHKCIGCKQFKTINFKPKEEEKQFKCECGKISIVQNKNFSHKAIV